jgi:hypothetical protein
VTLIVAGARRVRPGLAETRHRAIDDAGVDRLDRFIVEAIALEIADLVILHEDIDVFGELANDLLPFRRGNVDRHRTLVAVGAEIERVVVVLLALGVDEVRRSEGARVVAGAGPLDLDHVGAEIAQHLGRERTGEHAREIKNLDA